MRVLQGLQPVLYVVYLGVGFFQLFAIVAGIGEAFDITGLAANVIALGVTYIPLVGAGFGVHGAMTAWAWSWQAAAGLFFWFVPVFIVVGLFDLVFSREGR